MRSPLLAALAVLAAFVLSGCASSGTTDTTSFDGPTVAVSDTTGGIRGIVVDQAIVPLSKVSVALATPTGNKTALTDAQGRFTFGGLQPGTYFLSLSHLLYKPVQTSVEVKAGTDPPVTRIQMEAKFTAKPYYEQLKFKGIIACGYEAALISAPCVTDYSTIACNGGCVPQAHDTIAGAQGDNRAFPTSVGPNWQTIVIELIFQTNGQGTSDRMGVLLSYQNRTAGDWFGVESGTTPVLLRVETGVKHPTQQGEPDLLDPAGRSDLLILGSMRSADGQEAGVGVNQEFEVFQTTFYNAKPPEGWSFANGDAFPF